MADSPMQQAREFWTRSGFEEVCCALCGAPPDRCRTLFLARDIKYGSPGLFRFVRCSSCGLIFLTPRPKARDLGALYEKAGLEYYTDATAQHDATRADIVARHAPGRRLLDAGSGSGAFLRTMRDRGWTVSGVELNQTAAREQRDRHGLDVTAGAVSSAGLAPGAFHAITFWDVFEHLPDPLETLRETRRLLAPGGVAVFSMPNAASVEARVFGPRWFKLDTPRHLYLYTPRTFRALAGRAGLEVRALWCASTATGVLRSLRPQARPVVADPQRPAAPRGAAWKPLLFHGGLVPALRLLDAVNLGSHMIAVAHRKD